MRVGWNRQSKAVDNPQLFWTWNECLTYNMHLFAKDLLL